LFLPSISQADGLFDFQMKLAKKGNAEAEYKVGEMYETGFGVKKDMNEAMNWTTKSARQGHETAKFKLLYWDVEKNGLTAANKAEVEVLKEKAIGGNPQAQFYLGKMHAHGVGVKKNSDKAINWLNQAALVGVLAAERELLTVRESKQRQDLLRQTKKRLADEKQRAELAARQEQAEIEKQRITEAQKKANEKANIDDITKRNKAATEARLAAEKKAAEVAAIQAKIAAQEAAAKQQEAQKQALLKKRAADEKKRITQFESDPCSGKSARFLSTCR
jgi:TPR repeat protein